MLRRVFVAVVVVVALVGLTLPAYAHHHKHHHHHHKHHHSSSDSGGGSKGDSSKDDSSGDGTSSGDTSGSTDMATTPDSAMSDTAAPAATGAESSPAAMGKIPTGAQQAIQVETTAYSFGDNQGSNNATISAPVIHKMADGDGTYANPTTLAVPGHGGSGMQTPKGTRVYFQKYKFYGIVEDSGATPKKLRRFDIWSDGRGNSDASACMDNLTGTSAAILNPPPGEPVTYSGPRSDSKGCHSS